MRRLTNLSYRVNARIIELAFYMRMLTIKNFHQRGDHVMRIKHFTVLLTSIILILVFIPYTFAEDNSQRNLPGVAFARLGKGHILDLAYSPDGKQLAVAGSIGILIRC
jgi:membrane protein CcdC involved in cytochrome C biogenesis